MTSFASWRMRYSGGVGDELGSPVDFVFAGGGGLGIPDESGAVAEAD